MPDSAPVTKAIRAKASLIVVILYSDGHRKRSRVAGRYLDHTGFVAEVDAKADRVIIDQGSMAMNLAPGCVHMPRSGKCSNLMSTDGAWGAPYVKRRDRNVLKIRSLTLAEGARWRDATTLRF